MKKDDNNIEYFGKKKKKSAPIGIIAVIVVLIIAVVAGLIIFNSTNASRKVKRKLNLGDKYLTEMDYENAVLSYTDAINIDPKNEDAYLRLYEAYDGLIDELVDEGEYDRALDAVDELIEKMEEGVEETDSDKVKEKEKEAEDKKEEIEEEKEDKNKSDEDRNDEEQNSETADWDEEEGDKIIIDDEDGDRIIIDDEDSYDDYLGEITGYVYDSTDQSRIANAIIDFYIGEDDYIGSIYTDSKGEFDLVYDPGVYNVDVIADGYKIATYDNVEIESGYVDEYEGFALDREDVFDGDSIPAGTYVYYSWGAIRNEYTFYGDHQIDMNALGINGNGTYKIQGDKLVITYRYLLDGYSKDYVIKYDFKYENGKLYMSGNEFVKE